jgi:hypothetical protein
VPLLGLKVTNERGAGGGDTPYGPVRSTDVIKYTICTLWDRGQLMQQEVREDNFKNLQKDAVSSL